MDLPPLIQKLQVTGGGHEDARHLSHPLIPIVISHFTIVKKPTFLPNSHHKLFAIL